MTEVELPDGRIIEFPEGTSPEAIRAAMAKLAPAPQQRTPLGQRLIRTVRPTVEALGGAIGTIGGVAAGTVASPSVIVNPVSGGLVGAGLGYGLAKGGLDSLETALGYRRGPSTASEALVGGAKDVVTGSTMQATGNVIGAGVGRLIDGLIPKSAAASRLPQAVQDRSTLGQLADRKTMAGRFYGGMEEVAQSIPIVGTRISNARDAGVNTWRDATIDSVSPPGFKAGAGEGSERIAEVYKAFKRGYGGALANKTVSPSQMFESQVLKITSDPRRGLSPEQAENIRNTVMAAYQARFQGLNQTAPAGTAVATGPRPRAIGMPAREAKDFESFLSDFARRYTKGQGPMDDKIGGAYGDIERAWTAAYRRQLGPQVRAQLKPLDQQYAKYVTVENAAGSTGALGGNFTPQQLNNSAKVRTGQRRYGRGEGILHNEAQDAKEVFMNRIPNSGTTDRTLGALGLAGGVVIDPVMTGTSLAVLGAGTTKAGKSIMLGETATQRLLQQIQAQRLLQQSGIPVGATLSNLTSED